MKLCERKYWWTLFMSPDKKKKLTIEAVRAQSPENIKIIWDGDLETYVYRRCSRKKLIKQLMALGIPRNTARKVAEFSRISIPNARYGDDLATFISIAMTEVSDPEDWKCKTV